MFDLQFVRNDLPQKTVTIEWYEFEDVVAPYTPLCCLLDDYPELGFDPDNIDCF